MLATIPGIKILEHNRNNVRKTCPTLVTWMLGLATLAATTTLLILPTYITLNLVGIMILLIATVMISVFWMLSIPVRMPEEYRIMRTNECSIYHWNQVQLYYDLEPVSNNVYIAQPKFERDIWRKL